MKKLTDSGGGGGGGSRVDSNLNINMKGGYKTKHKFHNLFNEFYI